MLQHRVGDGIDEAASYHIVQELNRRVVDEYEDVTSRLFRAAQSAGNPQMRRQFTTAAERLASYADTHRALMAPRGGRMNLGDHISLLCKSLLNASFNDRGVQIALRTDEILLRSHICWRIGLIVRELICNSGEHLGGGPGEVLIELRSRLGEICCLVSDNGPRTDQPVRPRHLPY
jgi:two-component sensor histidine kinase